MTRPSAADVWGIAVLVMLLGAAYGITARPGQDWGGDFAQYINHAHNLALGRPYAETRYIPTFPDAAIHMPPVYPPVFPVLLAPLYAYYGLDYGPMKVLAGAMFVLASLMSYAIARMRGLAPWLAAIGSAAFGLSGLVLGIKDQILSEGTYLFFAGLTLAVMLLVERRQWDQTRPALAAGAVLAPMLAAYGSRAIGLSLAVAFVLHALVWRRFRLFQLLVAGGFAAGVFLYAATFYDSRSYGIGFETSLHAYWQNTLFYLRAPAALWAGSPTAVRYPLFALSAVMAATEWFRQVLRRRSILEFYMMAAAGPVLMYSSGGSIRYMLPVLAFYFVYFLEGVEWLSGRWRTGRWMPAAAGMLLALGAAFNLRGMEKGPYAQGVEQPTFTELCAFLRREVDAQALVVSWNPRVVALYTGLPSAWYPETDDQRAFDLYLDRTRADFVLVYSSGSADQHWLAPHIAREPARFALVFRNADFALYRCSSEAAHP